MSKAEIASWITSTSTDFGDDDEIDNDATESKAQLSDEEKWSEFLSLAKSSLLTSQTKRRTEFLNDKMMALAVRGDLSLSQIMDLLGIIALTYPRYVDSPSRDGVINVLKALVKRDELRGTPEGEADANKLGVGENIFQWLGREIQRIGASRSSVALSNQVILFTWCCALLETELKYNPGVTTSPLWKPLLTAMATSLDLALEEHENNKKSLQKAAVVVGRRVIRNNSSKIPVILETVLDLTKSSSNPTLFSPMIGLIVDVALHLKPSGKTEKPGVDIVNPFKGPILQHLVTDILSSKTVVPRHRAQAFESFVTEFVDEPDVIESIVPAIEKGTLRAPEGVLPSSRTVFKAYRSTISQDSLRKLLTPILNSTKSSNPLVRTEAGHFFEALTSKVSDSSVQELAASEIL
ncbi:translational activator of GCN4, partial [Tulasnella sp. 419]